MAFVSKFATEDSGLFSLSVNGFVPRTAIVPLVQDSDAHPQVLIRAGDRVREGQMIAQGKNGAVHATIPGTVTDVSVVQYPDGKQGLAAKIKLGGAFSYTGKKRTAVDWHSYDAHMLHHLLAEKGVVNTFKKCVPLSEQIQNLHPKSARVLVVRLFDDDPSRVTETFVAAQNAREVTAGAAVVAKAMRAAGIVFVRGADKKDAVVAQKADDVAFAAPAYVVGCDTSSYPAGTMHDLVGAVKKQLKDKPFADVGNRDVFVDVQTAIAAYRAVVQGTPLMENYVHVTGDCLNAGAIMKVKIGTTLGDLAMQCGGFKRTVAKIVINGIATGFSVSSLDVPVTKMVKSVAFLPPRKAKKQYDEPCIRCGACRKICPVALYPDMFYRSFLHGADATELEKNYAATSLLCTNCTLCNAVCPSRLPLSQVAALLKGASDEK